MNINIHERYQFRVIRVIIRMNINIHERCQLRVIRVGYYRVIRWLSEGYHWVIIELS